MELGLRLRRQSWLPSVERARGKLHNTNYLFVEIEQYLKEMSSFVSHTSDVIQCEVGK